MKCYLGICDKMDELGGYYAKWNVRHRNISFTYGIKTLSP
jgi:hypothetical protein